MSLFLIPPFGSVKILLKLIYYFTIFLSGDGFYLIFDPHNKMISAHVISLSISWVPKNVDLLVSKSQIRTDICWCAGGFIFLSTCGSVSPPKAVWHAIFNSTKSIKVWDSSKLSSILSSSAIILINQTGTQLWKWWTFDQNTWEGLLISILAAEVNSKLLTFKKISMFILYDCRNWFLKTCFI